MTLAVAMACLRARLENAEKNFYQHRDSEARRASAIFASAYRCAINDIEKATAPDPKVPRPVHPGDTIVGTQTSRAGVPSAPPITVGKLRSVTSDTVTFELDGEHGERNGPAYIEINQGCYWVHASDGAPVDLNKTLADSWSAARREEENDLRRDLAHSVAHRRELTARIEHMKKVIDAYDESSTAVRNVLDAAGIQNVIGRPPNHFCPTLASRVRMLAHERDLACHLGWRRSPIAGVAVDNPHASLTPNDDGDLL